MSLSLGSHRAFAELFRPEVYQLCTKCSRNWYGDGIETVYSLLFTEAILFSLRAVFARSPKTGAATTINAAVNPELNSQQAVYYVSCKPKISSADSRSRFE